MSWQEEGEGSLSLFWFITSSWTQTRRTAVDSPQQNLKTGRLPLHGNVLWPGVLWLQIQTVFTRSSYKRKHLKRHSSSFIFSLLRDALPRAFDAVPFQSKTRHEFSIAAVSRLRPERLSNAENFLRPCCLEQFSSSKLFKCVCVCVALLRQLASTFFKD